MLKLDDSFIQRIVDEFVSLREKKSRSQHELYGRYLNIDMLITLNLDLKSKLESNKTPKNIKKDVDNLIKNISINADRKTKELLYCKILETTIVNLNHFRYDIKEQDRDNIVLNPLIAHYAPVNLKNEHKKEC